MAETNASATNELAGLNPALRFKLSTMMFLQYAIWGIWAPILGRHLATLADFQTPGGTADQGKIGLVYMTLPIASIIAPFIAGQIADRYFAAQRFLALSQLLGGLALLVVTQLTSFAGVFTGMLVYNLLYGPTIALSNSITFQHWPTQDFAKIRIWGSIGWILIGWFFGLLWLKALGRLFHEPAMVDCLYWAAILSVLYAAFALRLPHTPPNKQAGNPWAFLDAVGMLRNPAFAMMAIVSFLVAIDMQLYFIWTQSFLGEGLGVSDSWIGPVQTFGQICEMGMMVLLPIALAKYGYRITMIIGIAAWGLRDIIFAIGQPTWLVFDAIALHGVGFAFFFTAIFMFTDIIAPKDIKSSAQSFLASVTIGCGMLVGSLLAGQIPKIAGGNWHDIYVFPAHLCVIGCILFLIGFRPKESQAESAAAEPQAA